VRLPNLSIYYEPAVAEPVSVTREGLGLRAGATAFWSGQSLFKYLPQYDDVFVRIAQAVGDCQFVFLPHFGAPRLRSSCASGLSGHFQRRACAPSITAFFSTA
jgi:predicted O-linked N-acetylglucosamine transferase (SPINDLY family)